MTDGQKIVDRMARLGVLPESMMATRRKQSHRSTTNRCPICESSLFGCTEPASIMCSRCPAKWEAAANGFSRGRRMIDQTIYEQAVWHAHRTTPEATRDE